jgi:hypothetical protein
MVPTRWSGDGRCKGVDESCNLCFILKGRDPHGLGVDVVVAALGAAAVSGLAVRDQQARIQKACNTQQAGKKVVLDAVGLYCGCRHESGRLSASAPGLQKMLLSIATATR